MKHLQTDINQIMGFFAIYDNSKRSNMSKEQKINSFISLHPGLIL